MNNLNKNLDHEDEIDFIKLYGILYINKYKIFFITLLTTCLGLAYSFTIPPIYQADALIQLEKKSNGGIGISSELSSLFGDTAPTVVSEIEILRSRMVLLKVIKNLELNINVGPKRLPYIGNFLSRYDIPRPKWDYISSYAWNGEAIKLTSLTVPDTYLNKNIILKVLSADSFSVIIDTKTTLIGTLGEVAKDNQSGFSINVEEISGLPGQEFIISENDPLSYVRALQSNLSVSEKGKQSSILQLKYKSTDRHKASKILNEITNVYLLQNLNRNVAEAESSLTFIREQIPEAELSLTTAEENLNAFKSSQDSVDLTFETRSLLEKSINITSELNLISLQEQELQKKYTKNHPLYQALLDKKSQFEKQLKKIDIETTDLPSIQQEMLSLSQDLEVAREIYLQLISRAQELSIVKAGTISNIRILDEAITNKNPLSPNKKQIGLLASLFGILLSTSLIILKSILNKGIMRPEDIQNLDIPVYATVNKINKNFNQLEAQKKSINILANIDPTNLAVESLRSLRTSLHFGLLGSDKASVSITSARPGEGKSFISINLATVAAQSGQKVCLVDTDMRRGYLNKYFNISRKTLGLSDIISGNANFEDVLIKDQSTGLYFIPAGSYPPNPSELLMSQAYQKLTTDLNKNFDLTIYDTPPILAVTDPVIIAKYVGMVLLIIQYQKTTINEISNVIKTFETNGLNIKGAVLNGYDTAKNPYGYGYGAYEYQYSYANRGKE